MASGPEHFTAAAEALTLAARTGSAIAARIGEGEAILALAAAWVDGTNHDDWAAALASTGPIPPVQVDTDDHAASSPAERTTT